MLLEDVIVVMDLVLEMEAGVVVVVEVCVFFVFLLGFRVVVVLMSR